MGNGKKFDGPIAGFDIGGTKIDAVLWRGGRVRKTVQVKTPKNFSSFLTTLDLVMAEMSASDKISRVGVAVAGAVDRKAGRVIVSPNLPFLNGVALREILRKRFAVSVRLENDANCFLLAEAKFGAAKGKKEVVALILGTGTGGALLIDGQIFSGHHGAAGEFGRMVFLLDQGGLDLEALTSSHGFRRLGFSDPQKASARAYRKIAKYLGLGLANLINIFDPELVLLGGGITRADKFSISSVKAEVKKHSVLPAAMLPPVRISRLPHACAVGAVSLFM